MSYRKFTKHVGFLGLTQLIGAIGGFIVLPLITKSLGAENYGIWTQLMVTMAIITPIAILNLPWALIRFLAGEKDREKIQDAIWSVSAIILAVTGLISLLLVIFSQQISEFFECPAYFVHLLAIIIIFEYLNHIFYNVFRAFQQIGKYCFFTILQEVGETFFIVLAIYFKYDLLGAILAVLVIRIINSVIMGGVVLTKIGFRAPRFRGMKQYLAFSAPTVPGSLADWAIQSSDRYLIGFFLGTLFVGYYSPAYVIGVFVINFLVSPLGFLLPAALSKLYDENKIDEVKIYLKYSLKYFLLTAIPAALGLTILSKQILTLLTTAEFARASYIVLPIVAISMLPMGINAIISQVIVLVKKTKVAAVISVIAALINLLLNFIFIPKFGIVGAAITTFISYTFTLLAIWIYSHRHIAIPIDLKAVIKSVGASVLMVVMVKLINASGLYMTLLSIAVGAAVYTIFIFLFKTFSREEICLFKKIIKKTPREKLTLG